MWKGAGSQEPEAAAVECRVAPDELGRFAAGYQQLALGVGSSADPLQWCLAPQEGSHRGFDLSQGEETKAYEVKYTGTQLIALDDIARWWKQEQGFTLILSTC